MSLFGLELKIIVDGGVIMLFELGFVEGSFVLLLGCFFLIRRGGNFGRVDCVVNVFCC